VRVSSTTLSEDRCSCSCWISATHLPYFHICTARCCLPPPHAPLSMSHVFLLAIGLWHGIEGSGGVGPCRCRSHRGGDWWVEKEETGLGRCARRRRWRRFGVEKGVGEVEGSTTIKGEEGAEAGSRCEFWWRRQGDQRFKNEDDKEKWKLTWLLCMHKEFV
jgi:hypothetical protein